MKVAQNFFLEQGSSGTRRAVQQILEKIQLNVHQVWQYDVCMLGCEIVFAAYLLFDA